MAIQSDSSGFLIGERRLKEMASGITKIEDNTKQILKVLSDSFEELQKAYSTSSTQVADAIGRQNRSGRSQDASDTTKTARTARKTVDAAEQAVGASKQALFAAKRINKKAADIETGAIESTSKSGGVSSTKERAEKARDSSGRFVGKDGSDSEKKGLYSKAKEFFGGGGNGGLGGDASGIDPTLDALKELNEAVTPVKNVFKGMSARAVGIIRGRMKKRRADIVLPEEQVKANKETAKTDKKHTKLFESILRAIRGQNGAGGGGLLGGLLGAFGKKGKIGGLLGGLFKGGAKGLLKKIPFLGALIGGGLLAKDWGKLDAGGKGKGIGGIIGTVVGGALGSFFGPVGTVAGAGLGDYLGGIFGRKVGEWTESLKKIDFGAMFSSLLDDTKKYWKEKLDAGKENAVKAGGTFLDWGKGVLNTVGNTFSQAWRDTTGGDSASPTATTGDNVDYSKAAGNVNAAGNVATDKKARQLGMYNALRKAGFTHEQALAHGGQIGRENEYGEAMFGNHTDLAARGGKAITNGGVMSWNGNRYKAFAKHMRDRGLMDKNGNMPKTQAALDAQAEFMKIESENANYKKRMPTFNGSPHSDPKSMAKDMHAIYGWARGQDHVRDKNGNLTVPFDWRAAERRANRNTDEISVLAQKQSATLPTTPKQMPAAKGNPKQALIFPQGATRIPPIKVPAITPALAKIGTNTTAKAVSAAPSDAGIAQTVADRSLAHVISGGIGYNTHNT